MVNPRSVPDNFQYHWMPDGNEPNMKSSLSDISNIYAHSGLHLRRLTASHEWHYLSDTTPESRSCR